MSSHDFIIVGSGPAGSAAAWRLAGARKKPNVLLLEAGGANDLKALRADGDRWITKATPGLNWNYKSTPQKDLANREIELDRGKGLGGSSALNFGVYDLPPRDDWEEIARLVDSKEWSFEKIQDRFKRIETYHDGDSDVHHRYLKPTPSAHGTKGPLQIGHAAVLEKNVPFIIDVLTKTGTATLNLDINDGEPLGVGLCPNSAYAGLRTTSRAMLENPPGNLHIVTDAVATKIHFDGKRAVSVEANGKKYSATKDIILCTGSLDTPKLLMLSGVGPKEELSKHGIPEVHEMPRIGKGLKDHPFIPMAWRRKDHISDRPAFYRDAEEAAKARAQWEKDGTGKLSEIATSLVIGFAKSEALINSKEFKDLPKERQDHLLKPTVPHYEFLANAPHFPDLMNPSESVATENILTFTYNTESEGEVTLASANVADPPVIDSRFYSHPFDRRAIIEAMRDMIRFSETEEFQKDTIAPMIVPKSKSDEDIWEYVQGCAISAWHMTGTAKMGKKDDKDACVGNDFKLFGIEGLRIADMSVIPIIANCHVQPVAYVTGLTAADQLVREYDLD